MTDVQRLLEDYADTPVGEIDRKKAKEILTRSGFLTKSGKISAKYANIVVNKDAVNDTQPSQSSGSIQTNGNR